MGKLTVECDTKPIVLFLIPAHENNACLVDTINNIQKFNSNITCYFILYISPFFKDFDDTLFASENIVITYNLRTHYGNKYESQLESLIKSYTIGKQKFKTFDYITIFHTSQLFVKYGYYDYIKNYDFSYKESKYEEPLPERYYPLLNFNLFEYLMEDHTNADKYSYQMVESGFYKKEIFDFIEFSCYNFCKDLSSINDFFNYTPIEEIIIPTLANIYGKLNNSAIGKNTLKFPIDLNFDYILDDTEFSIKSIPRDINHPIRQYVRNK
jgi:hypothetical protein